MSKQEAVLQIDGAEQAIIGIAHRCGQIPLLVYSREKLEQHFVEQGMTFEEASEWISFNIEGAWLGEGTPIILGEMSPEDALEIAEEHNEYLEEAQDEVQ